MIPATLIAIEKEKRPERGSEAPPTFRAILRYFLWLGMFGFGGPIATVGYMQRDLVEGRHWVARQDMVDGIALGQTMPGPLAAQVAMWVGYLRRGAVGALGTATAFIMPSFLFVIGLSALYVRFEGLPWVRSAFYGVAPAVIAIVALAAWKLARLTNGEDRRLWVISILLGAVTAVTESEVALLFVAAGVLLLIWDAPPRWFRRAPAALLFLPGLALPAVASPGALADLFLFFMKAGTFIFGSGLAIVPFLKQGVIHEHHWLTDEQFFDAVAVGLITPGPIVITATFIGYLVAGLQGAIVATVGMFLPIYLGVVVPGRWFARHRDHPQIRAFVKGATAAAAGAIAGATVVLARQAIVDLPTIVIALLSLAYLTRIKWRLKEPLLVLVAAAAGLLIRGL